MLVSISMKNGEGTIIAWEAPSQCWQVGSHRLECLSDRRRDQQRACPRQTTAVMEGRRSRVDREIILAEKSTTGGESGFGIV
jgi:hypothetical protein